MNTARRTLSAETADAIREILAGGIDAGSYLPPERELAKRFGVSRVTVRRALGELVKQGLLETVPHQGYRPVAPAATAPLTGPVAYVLAQAGPDQVWDSTHEQIISAFNRRLMESGRHALAVGSRGRDPADIKAELREAGVWGVALDTSHRAFTEALADWQLPSVIVDSYAQVPGVDTVLQDNFDGARRACEYLVSSGCKRIGWVGPMRGNAHYREGFMGARAALNEAGRDFVPELLAEPPDHDALDAAREMASAMLGSRKRPDGLVCMWQSMALGAARAVRDAGLEVGEDVELVAWGTEREYREVLAAEFLGGLIPATATWRPSDMAALAIESLERRAAQPAAPGCRISVRVRLVEPRPAEDVVRERSMNRSGSR
ncbi:MAG: GntR family transcriptional regulator [Planctomycetota bacterium]|jgi:LacI family transcriptional regulator